MNEVKEDPVKLHKDGNALYESSKYDEAKENFLRASELYEKANNFFDATSMLYKAGECLYMLENHKGALELFLKSADLSFGKGLDRFGVSALEYVRDCYEALNDKGKVSETQKKIKKVKKKLAESI